MIANLCWTITSIALMGLLLTGAFAAVPHLDAAQAKDKQDSKQKQAPADEKTIAALIKKLADDSFEQREDANAKLAAIGEPALELLKNAASKSSDAEVRQRAQVLIYGIARSLFGVVREFRGHEREWAVKATRIVVSPDGKTAVSAGTGALRSWDIETGKQLLVFGQIPKPGYWALAVSQDGKRVIAGGQDKIARVFDLQTGKELIQLLGHTDFIWGAALLPDGKRAVTTGWDHTVRLWDVNTGRQISAFRTPRGKGRCLALSPDGKQVATGHFANTDNDPGIVQLWDVEKGKEIRSFVGHERNITSIAFSPGVAR